MAADPLLVGLLVGLGFRSFSMTPAAIPIVKRGLAALDSREAARIARRALRAAVGRRRATPLLEPMADAMHRAGRERFAVERRVRSSWRESKAGANE